MTTSKTELATDCFTSCHGNCSYGFDSAESYCDVDERDVVVCSWGAYMLGNCTSPRIP